MYVGGPEGSWSEGERHDAVEKSLSEGGARLGTLRIDSGIYAATMAVGDRIIAGAPAVVIVFHDTIALTTQPPLTSIALKAAEAARLAVRIVVSGQVSEMLTAQRIALKGELVELETADSAAL